MTTDPLVTILAAHLPRDRWDPYGIPTGTYCTCGDWEGDYFADGEAGPFDAHLAAAIRDAGWVHRDEVAGAREAVIDAWRVIDEDRWLAVEEADAALAAVTEHLTPTGEAP